MTYRKSCLGSLREQREILLASVAIMVATNAVSAPVQEQPSRGVGGVEEIIVTARKRVESVQEVPVAVTALSAAELERYDLTSLERLGASIPQLTVGRSTTGSGAQITLRGIGSAPTSIGIEQSVATVVDGVYYGQGRVINEGLFDSARIEVLKGPQALFFGKNATAGVISITTADPGDELEALGRVGYELRSHNLISETVVSSPLNDTIGVRLALRASKMWDGYTRNEANDVTYTTTDVVNGVATPHLAPAGGFHTPEERELLGRVTLKWQPTDRLTGTFKASAGRTKANNAGWNSVVYACPGGVSALNQAVSCDRDFTVNQNELPSDIAANLPYAGDGSLGNTYKSRGVTGTINYDLDEIGFTWVSNYQWNRNLFIADTDNQSTALTGTYAVENTKWNAFSTEFRALTTFDAPINLMLGMLYQRTKRELEQAALTGGFENSAAVSLGNRFVAFSVDSDTEGETIAGFGQAIWRLAPQWEVTAGFRYTHETKDSRFIHPYVHPVLTALWVPGVTVPADQTFNNWSPEATISWEPQEDINIYLAYKTAYKSGGFSNSGIFSALGTVEDLTFDPEKARGFEAGIKTTLFDRQLRFNVIGYTFEYSDLQVDFFNSPTFAFITTNAGSATTRGVEVELQWAPIAIPDLTVHGTINYNRARYKDYVAPCYAGQTPALGCTLMAPAPALTPLHDLSGVPTPMAPRWTGSLGANYEVPLGGLQLGLSAGARFSDDYLASSFGHPLSHQSSYVSLDASVRLRTEHERWELAVIGRNLTNRFILTGSLDSPSTGGGTGTPAGYFADQVGQVSLPRTVQVQLIWRY